MVWFRVDDGWHKHRKRIRAGLDLEGFAARGLWVDAGSWASDELTDGFVPDDVLDYLAPAIGQQLALRLERARLWVRGERNGEEGWQFWQWEDQQPTAEEVTAALSRKSSGGKLGNHRRWHVGEGKTDPKCPYCREGSDRISDRSSESVPSRSHSRGDAPGDPEPPSSSAAKEPADDGRADSTSPGTAAEFARPDRPVSDGGSDRGSDRYTDQTSDLRSESHANPTDPTRPDPTRPLVVPSSTTSKTAGETADDQPPTATPTQRAFGVARAWIAHREAHDLPIVVTGKSDPLHMLRKLIEPFAEKGYDDAEIKHALNTINEGVPSTRQLEKALTDRRTGKKAPGRSSNGYSGQSQAPRHKRTVSYDALYGTNSGGQS